MLGVAAPVASAADREAAPTDLLPRAIPAGPAATFAWTDGNRVRVAAPGVPARTVAWLRPRGRFRDLPVDLPSGRPALSRDGSRLVVVGDDRAWLVPITTGGVPVPLPTDSTYGSAEARWSADGRTVLIVGDDLARCTVAPEPRCETVGRGLVQEYGATVSPDGASVAYVRAPRSSSSLSIGDLVLRGPDGRGRVLVRSRLTRRRLSAPTPPTWTASGLVWSVLDARIDPKGGKRSDDLDFNVTYLRARTRVLGDDGAIRTVTAAPIAPRGAVPFLAFGGAPDGLAFGARYRLRGDAVTRLDLRLLAADGSSRPLGISLDAPERRSLSVLGLLADGRVAVRREGNGDADDRLYLVAPGATSLGPVVARGREVDVAAAYPSDARSF